VLLEHLQSSLDGKLAILKRRAVIGLNFLNGKGEMLPDFPEEVDGGLGVVVVVDT
jgi:hypothetical protein